MKKLIIPLVLVMCLATPLFAASDIFAQGEDGNLYVLSDNGTYSKFVENVKSEENGKNVDALASNFLNQTWDKAQLIDLGNTLSSYKTGKRYTTGEFYLLEFTKEDITSNRTNISGWSIPVMKTDKGTVVNGVYSEYAENVSLASLNRYNTTRTKTNTYTLIFECPQGETPSEIGLKTTDSETYTYYKVK